MKFIFAAAATALFAASPAFAADDSAFYVGAGFGSFGVDVDAFDLGSFHGDDNAWKVLGGWDYNKYFGVAVEYIDGGSATDKFSDGEGSEVKFNIDTSGFNASVVGSWPFTDQFSVFGELGWMFWDADFGAKISGPVCDALIEIGESCSEKDSDSGSDFSWGFGANWYFTDSFGLRLEYQRFEIADTDTVDLMSGSVLWKFKL